MRGLHHASGARRLVRTGLAVALTALAMAGCAGPVAHPSADDPAEPDPTARTVRTPLTVSGTGVGDQGFGTPVDEVFDAVHARLGSPDLIVGPQRFYRIRGERGFFEDARDNLSPRWRYRATQVTCWRTLCLMFGGRTVHSLQLRGWELGRYRRWGVGRPLRHVHRPDVRLAGSGLGLGATWQRLHAAYPETTGGGGEGAALTVRQLPWDGFVDGVGEWRLTGSWDYRHPNRAPARARVTRLSGGEGAEPGCC